MYYAKIEEIQTEIPGFPKKYPIIWLISDEEIRELKELFITANILGYLPEMRSVSYDGRMEFAYRMSDVLNKLEDLNELTSVEKEILDQIPCWNPFEDSKILLTKYIVMMEETQTPEMEDLKVEIMNLCRQVREERGLILNKKGD
jgi:hypothetical protein